MSHQTTVYGARPRYPGGNLPRTEFLHGFQYRSSSHQYAESGNRGELGFQLLTDSYLETVNLVPLFTAAAAVRWMRASPRAKRHAVLPQLAKADRLADTASQAGWQPARPAPPRQSGILLRAPNYQDTQAVPPGPHQFCSCHSTLATTSTRIPGGAVEGGFGGQQCSAIRNGHAAQPAVGERGLVLLGDAQRAGRAVGAADFGVAHRALCRSVFLTPACSAKWGHYLEDKQRAGLRVRFGGFWFFFPK